MGILKPHKPSDYPSFLLYVLDETHITLTVLTASIILWTRDAHAAYFAVGALGSSLTAKLIKTFIKSPRPPPPPPSTDSTKKRKSTTRPKKTYGMPSTHSTALSFYFFYLLPLVPTLSGYIFTQSNLSPQIQSSSQFQSTASSTALQTLVALGITTYWVGGTWSRVELGYHTWIQCFGGVGLGGILAAGWRVLWETSPVLRKDLQALIDYVWKESLGRILG